MAVPPTSGTTGRDKLCPQVAAAFAKTVELCAQAKPVRSLATFANPSTCKPKAGTPNWTWANESHWCRADSADPLHFTSFYLENANESPFLQGNGTEAHSAYSADKMYRAVPTCRNVHFFCQQKIKRIGQSRRLVRDLQAGRHIHLKARSGWRHLKPKRIFDLWRLPEKLLKKCSWENRTFEWDPWEANFLSPVRQGRASRPLCAAMDRH